MRVNSNIQLRKSSLTKMIVIHFLCFIALAASLMTAACAGSAGETQSTALASPALTSPAATSPAQPNTSAPVKGFFFDSTADKDSGAKIVWLLYLDTAAGKAVLYPSKNMSDVKLTDDGTLQFTEYDSVDHKPSLTFKGQVTSAGASVGIRGAFRDPQIGVANQVGLLSLDAFVTKSATSPLAGQYEFFESSAESGDTLGESLLLIPRGKAFMGIYRTYEGASGGPVLVDNLKLVGNKISFSVGQQEFNGTIGQRKIDLHGPDTAYTLTKHNNVLEALTHGGPEEKANSSDDGDSNGNRIKFKSGATTAEVTGQLNGWNDKAHFVIKLRAGQTIRVSVEGKCDSCTPDVSVDSPTGAQDTMDPDMCQCRVEVANTAAGDYRITVGENRKGGKWKGAFTLNIEVR